MFSFIVIKPLPTTWVKLLLSLKNMCKYNLFNIYMYLNIYIGKGCWCVCVCVCVCQTERLPQISDEVCSASREISCYFNIFYIICLFSFTSQSLFIELNYSLQGIWRYIYSQVTLWIKWLTDTLVMLELRCLFIFAT